MRERGKFPVKRWDRENRKRDKKGREIRINTYGDGGKRKRTREEESKGMIAREIRPSIGGGGYQRNKGTAGGKVHAISAKKSLVKGVGRWRVVRRKKIPTWRKKKQKRSEGVSEDRFCII